MCSVCVRPGCFSTSVFLSLPDMSVIPHLSARHSGCARPPHASSSISPDVLLPPQLLLLTTESLRGWSQMFCLVGARLSVVPGCNRTWQCFLAAFNSDYFQVFAVFGIFTRRDLHQCWSPPTNKHGGNNLECVDYKGFSQLVVAQTSLWVWTSASYCTILMDAVSIISTKYIVKSSLTVVGITLSDRNWHLPHSLACGALHQQASLVIRRWNADKHCLSPHL